MDSEHLEQALDFEIAKLKEDLGEVQEEISQFGQATLLHFELKKRMEDLAQEVIGDQNNQNEESSRAAEETASIAAETADHQKADQDTK